MLLLVKFWPAAGALSSNWTTSSYTVISWSDKKTKGRFLLAIPTEKKRKRIQLLNNEHGQKSLYALMVSIVNVNPLSVPTWIISPGDPLSIPILRPSRRLLSIVDLTSNPMKPKINLCYYNHIWREKYSSNGGGKRGQPQINSPTTQGIEILS